MHQKDKRYSELAEKWLNGTITEEEKKEFAEWYDACPGAPLEVPPGFAQSEEHLRQRILRAIMTGQKEKGRLIPLKKNYVWTGAAAVCLVVCTAVLYFSLKKNVTRQPEKQIAKKEVHEIHPGGNRAILVLADGSQVVLDTVGTGNLAKDGQVQVIKLREGELAYSPLAVEKKATGHNTLTTPRGGQYSIMLSDGTKVWLNSATSLRFPEVFTGAERMVELHGEAYFEVAKDPAHPFRVRVNDMDVRVLGTHFNVMAYEDEEAVRTTLLEGSVRIHHKDAMALLVPRQQAQVSPAGPIRVRKDVDLEEVMAWKNGLFNFEGAGIETIMRQIARWYDIEVVYEGRVPDHFSGTISRNVGIEKVFRMLELTGAVHFSVNGNKIKVRS